MPNRCALSDQKVLYATVLIASESHVFKKCRFFIKFYTLSERSDVREVWAMTRWEEDFAHEIKWPLCGLFRMRVQPRRC